jgi:hypothetical protein
MRTRLSRAGGAVLLGICALPLAALAVPAVRDALPNAVDGNRAGLYETVTSVSAAMLGFVIAALAILLGLGGGTRVTALVSSRLYGAILRLFTRAARLLAATTVVALGGILLDRDYGGGDACSRLCDARRLWIWVVAVLVVVAAASLGYCLRVLRAIVRLVGEESDTTTIGVPGQGPAG